MSLPSSSLIRTSLTLSYSAVNEIGPVGNLQSFLIDEEGGLSLVDTVATGGNGPTFTEALSGGEVSAMNVSFH